jgi:tetratricopeptide (TPR) repeat protein
VIWAVQGKIADAIAEYQTAIRLDPKNAKPHYNLATLYLSTASAKTGLDRKTQLNTACGEFMLGAALAPSDPIFPTGMHDVDSLFNAEGHCPPV